MCVTHYCEVIFTVLSFVLLMDFVVCRVDIGHDVVIEVDCRGRSLLVVVFVLFTVE